MAKLSKQDKIDIYNLWKHYSVGPLELSKKYNVNRTVIIYLLALLERHGIERLDQPRAKYSVEFRQNAINQVLVEGKAIRAVALDLGLPTKSLLIEWIQKYKRNGYTVVIKKRGHKSNDFQQETKSTVETRARRITPTELEAQSRDRIYKKVRCLSCPTEPQPTSEEIAKAVTKLSKELKVTVVFVLKVINEHPDLPSMSRSGYYYTIKKIDKDQKNQPLMEKIREIYEKHKHRYGYRRIALELKRQGICVNKKKVKRLMSKMKLYGIAIKRRFKYSSYRGTFGAIKPNLIKRDFSAKLPNQKWFADVTEFNLRGQKTYLSALIDGCTQEVIASTISRSPNLKQTMDMLKQATKQHKKIDNLVFHTDQGWQYQHHAFQQWLESHGIEQSMSRKGNSLDDGLIEGFFAILKREMYYGFQQNFQNLDELEEAIREYIKYYNHDRIKNNLKGLTPIEYRYQTLGKI